MNQSVNVINYQGNTLLIPAGTFPPNISTTIASFIYKNLSEILVSSSSATNQSLISPVISSTSNCTNCTLHQPVTISFNIPQIKVYTTTLLYKCYLLLL